MSTLFCKHEDVGSGPRLPLLYGSAATAVCKRCGVWRDARGPAPQYKPAIRWRAASELLIAIATRDDDDG